MPSAPATLFITPAAPKLPLPSVIRLELSKSRLPISPAVTGDGVPDPAVGAANVTVFVTALPRRLVTVSVDVAPAVGVPEISPCPMPLGIIVRPAGSGDR